MARRQAWLKLADGLEFEVNRLMEEGREVPPALAEEIGEVVKLPDGEEKNRRAQALFEKGQALPYASGGDEEPSDLEGIAARSRLNPAPAKAPEGEALYDRIYGAWLGRCAGCLLGKPVEGWRTPRLHGFLKATGNYPLSRYMRAEVSEKAKAHPDFPRDVDLTQSRAFIDRTDCMPEDDDTNYTVIALKLIETYGRDFTPADAAECWLQNLPILHLCTAERIAYRNLVMGLEPPATAAWCNGYREWIGAQIRGDLFGYVNPGDPHSAARMAWRDACVSHVKNGIYGEMWVAAMLAQAQVSSDMEGIIWAGLNEIPTASRLHTAIGDVLSWKQAGLSWEGAVKRVSQRWDENNGHHWCHTISNAQLVAAALLYGEGDLGKTLCMAVMPGFDTDCNGATAGSVVGAMRGAKSLPGQWIAPLNDALISGVDGFGRVRISDMARRTAKLAEGR